MTNNIVNELKYISELKIKNVSNCNNEDIFKFMVLIYDFLEHYEIHGEITVSNTKILSDNIKAFKYFISTMLTCWQKNLDLLGFILLYQARCMKYSENNNYFPNHFFDKLFPMSYNEAHAYKQYLYHDTLSKLNYYIKHINS